MLTEMLNLMEARLNSAMAIRQMEAQSSVSASVVGAALGVFQALSALLAVRLLLLMTLAGGFFLADLAMNHQTAISVWVLIAYSVLVIFPISVIEYGRKIQIGGQNG